MTLKAHNPQTPLANYSHGIEVPPNARWLHISGQVAVDKDGAASPAVTHRIDVRTVALLPDPVDPGKLSLFVVGTDGNDLVHIDARKSAIAVTAGALRQVMFKPTGRIIVLGGGEDAACEGARSCEAKIYL